MIRAPISVRRAMPESAGALTELWMAGAVAGGLSQEHASRAVSEGRIAAALSRPGTTAYVATHEGVPAGYVVVSSRTLGLLDETSVSVDDLFVLPALRGSGVGRQLLGAVARHAESQGSDLIVCHVPAQDKDTNRYFARLGFGSQVVRRVIPTAVLRKRLSPEESSTSSLDLLLGRRRTIRARATRAARAAAAVPTPRTLPTVGSPGVSH